MFGLVYPLPVLTVHDEHEALCASVVMSPEWPDLVLPSDIPDVEPHVLVCYSLDVKADCCGRGARSGVSGVRSRRGYSSAVSNHLPVGMVVTDWLSFSLYRMAARCGQHTRRRRRTSPTHWSFLRHPDPTSTTASPCSQRSSLVRRDKTKSNRAKERRVSKAAVPPYVRAFRDQRDVPNAFERFAPMAP